MIAKPRQYIFVILLAIAGILIISSSAYSIKVMHDVADIHTPLVDAAMEIKFELAMTHLQLEKHIAGDKTISTDEVVLHLKQAKWYARAMLSGGQNAEGLLIPLEDNALRRKITTVVERITRIDGLVQARLSDIKLVQPGSKIDQQLDRLFEDTLKEADSVEDALLAILVKEQSMQKTINYSALMLSIMLFAIVIGFVIFNRRFELKHINRLYELANLDELTGINNRRSFNSILSDEWNRAMRAQYSLTLVICDIDFFKNYNDAIGHQAGDECLRAVVEVMQSILQRPVDSVARYGGEEFAFILPFTDEQGAINMINRLHGKLKMKKILHPNSEISDYVTLSAGVASLTPGSKHSIEELISVADKSLYRAKAEGRNRTCYKVLS